MQWRQRSHHTVPAAQHQHQQQAITHYIQDKFTLVNCVQLFIASATAAPPSALNTFPDTHAFSHTHTRTNPNMLVNIRTCNGANQATTLCQLHNINNNSKPPHTYGTSSH